MMKKIAFLGSVALVAVVGITPAAAQFRAALDVSKQTVAAGKKSQQRIAELDEQAGELLGDYRANIKQRDIFRRFNASRAREIENQLLQVRGLEQDVENIQGLQRAILPLLEEMIDRLEQFVAADTPFLEVERNRRLTRLRSVMADSTQTAAARYNLILEAYQIENEYGRTMDSYSEIVENEGEELKVEFLRIGRLSLIYKSADNSVLRIYNSDTRTFEDLDMKYLDEVRKGIRIANKQTTPDLMQIPVTAPERTDSAQ